MPRIRSIKPELPDDAKLAKVSRDARYTFVLLISKADDDGLVPGVSRQLLGLLYPHDEDVTVTMVLGWIGELETIGVVRWRQTKDGAAVVEIVNWSKHQRIDNKGRTTLRGELIDTPPQVAESRGESRNLAESRGESRNLAESRGLDRDRDREVEKEVGGGEGEGKGALRRTIASRSVPDTDSGFDEFWHGYPRRAGNNPRGGCLKAWRARRREGVAVAEMVAGRDRYVRHLERVGKLGTEFVMQGRTFLGPDKPYEQTWEDGPPAGQDASLEARAAAEWAAVERDAEWLASRRVGVHG